jgi:serine/threonine protein phosphatase PrpC
MESRDPLPVGERALVLHSSAASDVGLVRSVNEDSFLDALPVFLVADGMGGHAHGDLASREVVRVFRARHAGEGVTTASRVLESIAQANTAVRQLTESSAENESIAGTTLTGVALIDGGAANPPSWMAFNVGDSRVYSWQADRLTQITVDHSAVQELVDQGNITRAEADAHPERNVVTRAMGVDDNAEPDVWLIPTGGKQLFLLCSDGLTKELSDDRIADLIRQRTPSEAIAERLVAEALSAGGNDNVTAVVVEADWAGVLASDDRSGSAMPAFLEETAPRL